LGTSLRATAKLRENIIRVERFAPIGFGNGGEKSSLIGIIEAERTLFREENRYRGSFPQRLTPDNDLISYDSALGDAHGSILSRACTTINVWTANPPLVGAGPDEPRLKLILTRCQNLRHNRCGVAQCRPKALTYTKPRPNSSSYYRW